MNNNWSRDLNLSLIVKYGYWLFVWFLLGSDLDGGLEEDLVIALCVKESYERVGVSVHGSYDILEVLEHG